MKSSQTVIFLPGLLDDSAMWVHQVAGLSDIADPLAIDLVRHETVSQSAEWVLDCAPSNFTLVGFSMGGYVALEILRKAPERVTNLALISTSARADTPERTETRKTMIARTQAGEYSALVDEILSQVVHPSRVNDDALLGAIRDMALRIGEDAFVRQLKVIMSRPDSREGLHSIQCPALVICGRNDTLTPPEHSDEMNDALPNSELSLIDECGHYAPMERPEAVTALLRQWLIRLTS